MSTPRRPRRATLTIALLLLLTATLCICCCGGGGGGKPVAQAPAEKEDQADKGAKPNEATEAEVRKLFEERLQGDKERHAAEVAQHEVDQKRYDTAMEDFKRATVEYPTFVKDHETKKRLAESEYVAKKNLYDSEVALHKARLAANNYQKAIAEAKSLGRGGEVQRLTDFLDERFADVVRKYPGTTAATDAQALRKGGNPTERVLPPAPAVPNVPAPPAKPVEPTRPIPPKPLTPPEELLAAAKLEHEQAIARAEEEKRKKREAAEAKATALKKPKEFKPSGVAPAVGEEGYLYLKGEEVPVAIDQKAHDDLHKFAIANDDIGINQLIRRGRVLLTPSQTKIRVIDTGFFTYEVRLLSGPHSGKSVLIVREWVHK